MAPSLLEVQHLFVSYRSLSGTARAVQDVSLQLSQGETLALAGETGSGKSTLALTLLGLLDHRNHMESGDILFEGRSLRSLQKHEWKRIRGRKMGIIFQDSRSALNPILTVGDHLVESLRAHQGLSKRQAQERALEILSEVGIPEAEYCMARYPFELSGGICQRLGIALGVCNNPRLLVADEPTSALDPTIQAQILDLLKELRRRYGLALLLISHNLPLISQFADRVSVMYHGRLVESGLKEEVFASPAHPYTRGLLQCQPTLRHHRENHPLVVIPGTAPAPGQSLPGCVFAPRCDSSEPRCTDALPEAHELSKTHWASCVKARNPS